MTKLADIFKKQEPILKIGQRFMCSKCKVIFGTSGYNQWELVNE